MKLRSVRTAVAIAAVAVTVSLAADKDLRRLTFSWLWKAATSSTTHAACPSRALSRTSIFMTASKWRRVVVVSTRRCWVTRRRQSRCR